MRSEWFAASRADSAGSMGSYMQAVSAHQQEIAKREIPGNYQSAQWYPLGPSKTTHPVQALLGLVKTIWIDTSDFQTIYAGSSTGGIFRTTDGGGNWISLADNYITTGVLSIQVDPSDKNKIYIGTGHDGFGRAYGQGVMKSNDRGLSWESTGLNNNTMASNYMVREIALLKNHPEAMLALANTEFRLKGLIYRTTNGAESWEEVYSDKGAELFSIKPDPLNADIIYVTGNRFLKSIDAGTTWIDQSASLPLDSNFTISRVEIAKTALDPNLMLAVVENYDTTASQQSFRVDIFKSTDNGLSFNKIGIKINPYAGYWKMELEISPANKDEFYLGGLWLFKYRVEADSARYIPCSDHEYHFDIRDLHVYSGNEKDLLYMANDGGVTRSENGAESWQDITRKGLNITQFHNITIGENSDMMFAGPQDANLSFYNFKTTEWTKNPKISDAYEGAIDHQNPEIVFMVRFPPYADQPNKFLMKSVDGGVFFNYFGIPDSTEIGRNDKPLAMDPVNPGTLYVGIRNVWKTTDGALSWEKITDFPPEGDPKLIDISIAPSNNKVIAAAFENPSWGNTNAAKLWITNDGGGQWTNITPAGNLNLNYAGINEITFHPQIPEKFWLSLDREWTNRRVYMTTDGGTTWQNYSEGLPSLPVNKITYVIGAGYDVLLAATDAGVYYRDENMESWEYFGSGLPLTIVSDIQISYIRRKVIAGTYGRGLWETDLCMPLTEGEMAINDTVKWSRKRKVLQDVVINPGAQLTVSTSIEMGLDRKITVMPGAELVIDRGTITRDCAGMWDGIRLYGANNFDNRDLLQGKIILINGGSIQYADTAIKTIGINEAGDIIPGTGGGIIYAWNAKFINNSQGIEINPSNGINPGVFAYCQFITDDVSPGGYVGNQVSLIGSKGISFRSCRFENNLPLSAIPFHKRGTGIYSFNSSFSIEKLSLTDSTHFGLNPEVIFKQLATGIRASSSSPGFSAEINDARFERNFTGVYFAGMNLSCIKDCNFVLFSPAINDEQRPSSVAIYLDHCNFFNVSGNKISGPFGQLSSSVKSTGIIINQSGQLNHILFDNSISKTNFALIAQNSNRSANGYTGLRALYNRFSNNEYDICITNDSTRINNGLALHQGSDGIYPNVPAGNQFGYSNWHSDADIHNEGEFMYYHFHREANADSSKPVNYYKIYPFAGKATLPDEMGLIPAYLRLPVSGLNSSYNEYSVLAETTKTSFQEKSAAGNSTNITDEIVDCTTDQIPVLSQELRLLSPYISNNVLISLIKQKNIPNAVKFDILSHNIHFLRNKGVLSVLEEMQFPFEDYMTAALMKSYDKYSGLELLEAQMNATRAVRDHVFVQLAVELHDSLTMEIGNELLVKHLLSDERPESHYLAAFRTATAGDYTEAEKIISAIHSVFPELSDTIQNDYLELFNLNKHFFPEGSAPVSLDSTETELLRQMTDKVETGIYAINILNYFGTDNYIEPYIFPGTVPAINPPEIPTVNLSETGLDVYPIPANTFVVLDYFSGNNYLGASLQIHNITGQLVKEIKLNASYGQIMIDVSQLIPGNYIFVLFNNSEKISEKKVLISR
ncbi:MAG: T9SS type A sorting domain-containing protein [Lentimicrobium sp.]|nr:T9SS type A sorting domain-containing protein [Lentimicrobium sp.]